MKYCSVILGLSFFIQIFGAGAAEDKNATTLIADGTARCAIVSSHDDFAKRCADKLAAYLNEQTGARPAVIEESDLPKNSHQNLVVLDGTPDHHLLSQLGLKLDVPTDRADAYHIAVLQQNQRTVIAVEGHSATGAKFGMYRLMEEMDLDKGNASVTNLDITASPFFKTRSASLFNIWRVPVAVIRQCNLESWPADKIQRNVDMYDAFGFNALETHDRFHEDFLKAVYGISREEWRTKVYAMCDRAHEDGMTIFLRQWGNSVALPVKELKGGYTPFGFVNLAPDIPSERKRWEAEIRDYVATNYASHIDHFVGHWADAGGIHPGSHATIKDAMLLHNELQAALRAINPKIDTTFNLWNMANPRGNRGWPGYVDHRSVSAAGILDKDVIIAQATRAASHPYSETVTEDILRDGYRAAVWSWRRGDTEVRFGDPGVRIRIHGVMGDYFHNLPESARKLEWHNIERNQHGLANDVNFYIAAKLMWDPKTDVDAALRKYCSLVFGRANAEPLAEAFLTLEASRDVENLVSKSIINHPAEGAERARRALAGLAKVKLPEGHHSRLPSVTSPEEMLAELRGSLAIIAKNAEIYAKEFPPIPVLIKDGKVDEAKALAAEIEKKTDPWIGTIAGGMEGMWLKETLQAQFENGERKGTSWFGFITHNVEKFEEKDSRYTIGGKGKLPAIALLELATPARRHAEFHFQCNVAKSGKSQNGGFAFGSSSALNALARCQFRVHGRDLRISGQAIAEPVNVEAAKLDPEKPFDVTVVVDIDQHRVSFKVGDTSAQADLDKSFREVRYYGYLVEKTQSKFGQIQVVAE